MRQSVPALIDPDYRGPCLARLHETGIYECDLVATDYDRRKKMWYGKVVSNNHNAWIPLYDIMLSPSQ